MALREPSIIERHIAEHFVPYAAAFAIAGIVMVLTGYRELPTDTTMGLIWVVLGAWVWAGPWMSRRLVRRWDAGER